MSNNQIGYLGLNLEAETWLTYTAAEGLQPCAERAQAHIVFMRASHYTVVISDGPLPVTVNYYPVVLLKVLREGDRIQIGQHEYTFRELVHEVVGPGSALLALNQRCLFCRTPFSVGDSVVYCPACKKPYHDACWKLNDGACSNTTVCRYRAPVSREAVK